MLLEDTKHLKSRIVILFLAQLLRDIDSQPEWNRAQSLFTVDRWITDSVSIVHTITYVAHIFTYRQRGWQTHYTHTHGHILHTHIYMYIYSHSLAYSTPVAGGIISAREYYDCCGWKAVDDGLVSGGFGLSGPRYPVQKVPKASGSF